MNMDTYNYWRDSRVQESMFSSCWETVHQEAGSAIISLKEDWVAESLYDNKVSEIFVEWKRQGHECMSQYLALDAKHTELRKIAGDAKGAACKEHGGYWEIPREERNRLDELAKQASAVRGEMGEESEKVSKLIEKEYDLDKFAKEMKLEPYQNHDDSWAFCLRVETKFEVCSMCSGSGNVVNPSIDAGGISMDDFREDPDFHKAYMSGRFDQTCPRCHGKNVESVPQFPEWLNKLIEDYNEGEWDHIHETCQERAMGA